MSQCCPSCGRRAPGGVCMGPHPQFGQQCVDPEHPFISTYRMTTVRQLFRAHAQMQAARPSAANWRDQHGDVTP